MCAYIPECASTKGYQIIRSYEEYVDITQTLFIRENSHMCDIPFSMNDFSILDRYLPSHLIILFEFSKSST